MSESVKFFIVRVKTIFDPKFTKGGYQLFFDPPQLPTVLVPSLAQFRVQLLFR